jgi:hypothetical protein
MPLFGFFAFDAKPVAGMGVGAHGAFFTRRNVPKIRQNAIHTPHSGTPRARKTDISEDLRGEERNRAEAATRFKA